VVDPRDRISQLSRKPQGTKAATSFRIETSRYENMITTRAVSACPAATASSCPLEQTTENKGRSVAPRQTRCIDDGRVAKMTVRRTAREPEDPVRIDHPKCRHNVAEKGASLDEAADRHPTR